jgi:hypothetical protein
VTVASVARWSIALIQPWSTGTARAVLVPMASLCASKITAALAAAISLADSPDRFY